MADTSLSAAAIDTGRAVRRVMILTNWFPPIRSGSSFYASSLARALTNRGIEVVVVTFDWGKSYDTASLPFQIYRLPVMKIPKLSVFYKLELMGVTFTPANYQRLKKMLLEHKPDVLHHVNHIFDSAFLSTFAGKATRTPVVGSITTPVQHQNRFKHLLMSVGDRLILGSGVRRWDGIVSLDHTVHQYVGKLYGLNTQARSVVVPFGVRAESMPAYETPVAKSERPQILMVGHIHPFRNPVQLIRAMPLVLAAIPRARLVLAGRVDLEEPRTTALQLGLTQDQVRFLGETPHDEVIRLTKSSHVFASWVTGPYHSLGTAPMEAMLCKTPVINDLPEELFGEGKLKDGENIVLVDSTDPNSIANGLIRLLQDEQLRQRIGENGRQFVLECLSWDSIAAQMESFYSRVLAKHRLNPESN